MFGSAAVPILVPGLARAFEAHESRMAADFGGRNVPAEWRPSTWDEEIAARRSAWSLLVEIAQRDPNSRERVAKSLAQCIRTALSRGLSSDVLTSLPAVEWSARGRALLVEALNHARTYDELDSALDEEVAVLASDLAGVDLEERSSYVLAASIWELSDDQDELVDGKPRVLVELVEDVARAGRAGWLRLAEMSLDGDPDTASRLFEELARAEPEVPRVFRTVFPGIRCGLAAGFGSRAPSGGVSYCSVIRCSERYRDVRVHGSDTRFGE